MDKNIINDCRILSDDNIIVVAWMERFMGHDFYPDESGNVAVGQLFMMIENCYNDKYSIICDDMYNNRITLSKYYCVNTSNAPKYNIITEQVRLAEQCIFKARDSEYILLCDENEGSSYDVDIFRRILKNRGIISGKIYEVENIWFNGIGISLKGIYGVYYSGLFVDAEAEKMA